MPAAAPPPGRNRLFFEKSPYLIQHSANPVDWYPWGEEAFEKARREDKPVFLSIGYSTCHWCHVMERESFEDPEVAALMNEAFVNVKVDREERPDVDAIYMSACQMMRGNGGWPLTVIMTPEGRPFFVATYLPKTGRQGLPGMLDLVPQIRNVWRDRRGDVDKVSAEVTEHLRGLFEKKEAASGPGQNTLEAAYASLRARFDAAHGGFGHSPKFPAPHNLLFLLRYWRRTGEPHALEMVERTLEAMACGGIYDHVGFGFHRYSTDERWFAPHFEKMIYDQALLAMAYTECHLATGKTVCRRTAEDVLRYVLRDMTDAEGGFYSAEDADSEAKEGKFYLWTAEEIARLLGEEDGRFVAGLFGVEASGNFAEEVPEGNILYMRQPLAKAAESLGVAEEDLRLRLDGMRRVLFEAREMRVRPHKDDKILADWNGLVIAALAKAGRAFGEKRYTDAAGSAVRFIMKNMKAPGGRLCHRYRDGEAAVAANLDDCAFMAWGLLELYESTLEVSYLEKTIELAALMDRYHWDPAGGGYFFAPQDGEALIVRTKEIYDGAVPSGNSAAAFVLSRLGRITGDPAYAERAHRIGRVFGREIQRAPAAFTFFMAALETSVGPSREIVVVGDPLSEDTRAMIRAIHAVYAPEATLLFKSTREEAPRIARIAPFAEPHTALGGRATAYVCEDFACRAPTTDVGEVLETLKKR